MKRDVPPYSVGFQELENHAHHTTHHIKHQSRPHSHSHHASVSTAHPHPAPPTHQHTKVATWVYTYTCTSVHLEWGTPLSFLSFSSPHSFLILLFNSATVFLFLRFFSGQGLLHIAFSTLMYFSRSYCLSPHSVLNHSDLCPFINFRGCRSRGHAPCSRCFRSHAASSLLSCDPVFFF